MRNLGQLLSSPARTEVLRVLACQPGALGLEKAARLADIHPHSAERALANLVREKLVKRTRTSTRALYVLNRKHPDFVLLEAVFKAATLASITAKSHQLQGRGRMLLPFIAQASQMLKHAKRTERVP